MHEGNMDTFICVAYVSHTGLIADLCATEFAPIQLIKKKPHLCRSTQKHLMSRQLWWMPHRSEENVPMFF